MMISNRTAACKVEYTAKGQRVTKAFTDAYAARRFYVAKYKAGANPKVIGAK